MRNLVPKPLTCTTKGLDRGGAPVKVEAGEEKIPVVTAETLVVANEVPSLPELGAEACESVDVADCSWLVVIGRFMEDIELLSLVRLP